MGLRNKRANWSPEEEKIFLALLREMGPTNVVLGYADFLTKKKGQMPPSRVIRKKPRKAKTAKKKRKGGKK